jgi:energy-coupling factor transporter ATP-binding protein EcfA2
VPRTCWSGSTWPPAAGRTAKTYSGGMRRRLDLAASLVGRPAVIFLDEPTTGLDPATREEMWEVVRRVMADDSTVLLTTQYLEEADALAGEITVIAQPRLRVAAVRSGATTSPWRHATRPGDDRLSVVARRVAPGRSRLRRRGPMFTRRRRCAAAIIAAVALPVSGCGSPSADEVESVAATFDDPSGDPGARCDLLAPATLATLENDRSAPCVDTIQELPLKGGEVTAVEIWGGDAQVRLSGDTVFLTETTAGWRVVAAGCTARSDAPYDCEVEGP